MVFKMDMEKAYDHVNLNFLLDYLHSFQFPPKWYNWIKDCITNVRQHILFNGDHIGWIGGARKLNQGSLLSPYHFMLCMEYLSFLIKNSQLRGIPLMSKATLLTHLLYANDILLFAKANFKNVKRVKHIFKVHSDATRQKINLSKSMIFFNKNMGKHAS